MIEEQENLSVKLLSNQDELVQQYSNNTESGSSLSVTWKEIKNGGIDQLTFSVDKNFNVLYYPGMQVYVYLTGVLLASAYANIIPEPETSGNNIQVECLGWQYKLKKETLTATYTDTLSNIFDALEPYIESVGLKYDSAKIDVPALTVSMTFDNNDLRSVIDSLNEAANYQILTQEYRWFIDNDKYLNVAKIGGVEDKLFEGWHYQNPEVELDDSEIVNKLLIYTGDNGTTYIGTVEDTDSQGQYGIYEEKLILPYEVDSATANNIGDAIVQYNKTPQKTIQIEDFIYKRLAFNKYGLSNQKTDFWNLLSECDSFDGFDFTNAPVTNFTLDDEHVLTGNLALKIATLAGSNNETFTFTPIRPYYSVSKFSMRFYTDNSFPLTMNIYAVNGDVFSFSVGNVTASLLVKNEPTVPTDSPLHVSRDGIENKTLGVKLQQSYVDQWILIVIDLDIFSLDYIEFVLGDDTVNSMWFDRLECLTTGPVYSELVLEEVEVETSNLFIKQKASFGGAAPSLLTAIKEGEKQGATVYDMFSKGV